MKPTVNCESTAKHHKLSISTMQIMSFKHFMIGLILLLCSCNHAKQGELTKQNLSEDTIAQIVPMDSVIATLDSADAQFISFFEKIMRDKNFQKSRVAYPIEREGQIFQNAAKWQYIEYYINSQSIPVLCGDTLSIFEKNDAAATVNLRIYDLSNRSFEEFDFARRDSIWLLTGTTIYERNFGMVARQTSNNFPLADRSGQVVS